jgi:hypothetical protein
MSKTVRTFNASTNEVRSTPIAGVNFLDTTVLTHFSAGPGVQYVSAHQVHQMLDSRVCRLVGGDLHQDAVGDATARIEKRRQWSRRDTDLPIARPFRHRCGISIRQGDRWRRKSLQIRVLGLMVSGVIILTPLRLKAA